MVVEYFVPGRLPHLCRLLRQGLIEEQLCPIPVVIGGGQVFNQQFLDFGEIVIIGVAAVTIVSLSSKTLFKLLTFLNSRSAYQIALTTLKISWFIFSKGK